MFDKLLSAWRRHERAPHTAPPAWSDLPALPANTAIGEWLPRFIAEARRVSHSDAEIGLPLCGSLGFDATLLTDATVIWHEYDLGRETPDVWRIASREERISAIILGAERMPQLTVLLPDRDPADLDCTECEATGYVFEGRVLCRACGGTGWIPLD